MRRRTRFSTSTIQLIAGIALLSASPTARGATSGEFDYPELLVTPRASERLSLESSKEGLSRFTAQIPTLVSGVSTLAAGISQLSGADPGKDPTKSSGYAGLAVGGAWVATSLALAVFHQPYSSAARDTAAMPAKSQREQLIRERFAEEAIKSQARLACRLKWLSVASNFGANAFMLTKATSGSFSQVANGVAAALAFTPLVFRSNYQQVADEQESYKKRIYGPVAGATLFSEPTTGKLVPGAMLSFSF